jgi:hypothetical protein
MRTMIEKFEQVLDSRIEQYHAPIREKICGVNVYFDRCPAKVQWSEWKNTLTDWLPAFEQAGWLQDFNCIMIGDGAPSGEAIGRYTDCSISLENDVKENNVSDILVSDDQKYVLTHEILHHAHLYVKDCESRGAPPRRRIAVRDDVSWYAGENINEFVAEVGTGIVHGHEFPDYVHILYEEYGGPQQVYELNNAI